MSSPGPTRTSDSLADVVEMLLDKGIVINADIVVSVGQTELLGIELRAAIASFETAAQYGLQFPEGTDMRRVEAASGRDALPEGEEGPLAPIIDASSTDADADAETSEEAEDDDTSVEDDTELDAEQAAETSEAIAESRGDDADG